MKKYIFVYVMLVLCFSAAAFGQQKTAENQYRLTGIVKDQNSAIFAGLSLFFKSETAEIDVSTDVNGKFSAARARKL